MLATEEAQLWVQVLSVQVVVVGRYFGSLGVGLSTRGFSGQPWLF